MVGGLERGELAERGYDDGGPAWWLARADLTERDPAFRAGLRDWVRRHLHGSTPGAVREAAVVLDELLGNAYRHARPPYRVRLAVLRDGHLLWLEVDDAVAYPETGWSMGRGLLTVRGLCPDWGVTPLPDGKTVWAELFLLRPPSAVAASRTPG
ncbi:MAG: ATP-binding protein [Micromonosporaceae bacterium]